MSHELDAFLFGLFPGATTKTSGLDALTASDLGLLYGTPAPHLEAAEKLAHDAACFLEQFEGTPLHAKAIALVGEELQLEAERIQRDEARRAQAEPLDDSWSKQRMLDLKKRQLELELHKAKAQHEASEAPEQEIAEHAEGVPAPQTSGGVPAKTASELAVKLARRSSTSTYYDRNGSYSRHSSQPEIDELRLAQRTWSKMSPEQRKREFGHLPFAGALSLGLLGGIGGGHVGALGGPAGSVAGATLGAVGGGLLGRELGRSSQRHQASREEVPTQVAYRLARRQIAEEEGGHKRAADAGLAALLKGRQAESWRNAASYLSPKDLLGKAVESGKTQAGGMSRSVATYAPARARLHQLAAGGNTVAAEALKRGELDLEKAAGLQEFLTRLTSTRAQRLAKMDARGAAALAKSRAASPARSAVRGMIDELRGSMPRTTASEVSGVRRLPTSEAARISSRPPLARASIERHAG